MGEIFETLKKFRIERTIEVQGKMTVLYVDGQIDVVKKRWTVSRRRTTKTYSHNPGENTAVLQQLGSMEAAMMSKLEALRAELGPDDTDGEIAFPPDEDEDEVERTPQSVLEFQKPKGNAKEVDASEYQDGDGGPDDESDPMAV